MLGAYAGLNGSVIDTSGSDAVATFTTTRTIEKGEMVVAVAGGGTTTTWTTVTVGALDLQLLSSNVVSNVHLFALAAVAREQITSGTTVTVTQNVAVNPITSVCVSLTGVRFPKAAYSNSGNASGATSAAAPNVKLGDVQLGLLTTANDETLAPGSGETEVFEATSGVSPDLQLQYLLATQDKLTSTLSWTWGSTSNYATIHLVFPCGPTRADRSRFPKPRLRR